MTDDGCPYCLTQQLVAVQLVYRASEEELNRGVSALKEKVEAEKWSGKQWEDDCTSIYEACGQRVSEDQEKGDCVETVTGWVIGVIQKARSVCIEVAAHSECHCEAGMADAELKCAYCEACAVVGMTSAAPELNYGRKQ